MCINDEQSIRYYWSWQFVINIILYLGIKRVKCIYKVMVNLIKYSLDNVLKIYYELSWDKRINLEKRFNLYIYTRVLYY